MVTALREAQPWKAASPTAGAPPFSSRSPVCFIVSKAGRRIAWATEAKPLTPSLPGSGMTAELRFQHQAKAWLPKLVRLAGRLRSVRAVQPQKA